MKGAPRAASPTLRSYALYVVRQQALVEYVDGTVDSGTGNLKISTVALPIYLQQDAVYVVEVETSVSYSALYLYKKGESRGQGVAHLLRMDWRAESGGSFLSRRLTASALGFAEGEEFSHGDTRVLNLSESVHTPRTATDPQSTTRGFTLHEHLDSVGLVHMNGRIYDPVVGRFLSADPNVFYPEDMQDHNRYSYVHNNPLSFTDPSGHFLEELGGADLGEISISLGDAIGSFIGWSSSVVGSVTTNYGISRVETQSNVTSDSLGGAAYLTPTKTAITNVADRAWDASIHYQSAGNYVAGINDAVSFGLATQFWAALGYDTSYTSSDSYQAGLLTGATGMMWLGAESLALNGGTRSAPVVSEVANRAVVPVADEAFHYTFSKNLSSIETNGLRQGSFATNTGNLSLLQAQINLALPPNRGLPDSLLRIDLKGLRSAGYEIPQPSQVAECSTCLAAEQKCSFPIPSRHSSYRWPNDARRIPAQNGGISAVRR